MMEQEKSTGYQKSRIGRLGTWVLLGLALVGTYTLSHELEDSYGNSAAVFFGMGSAHEIALYEDRIEPNVIDARIGDEINFVIRDQSIHNIAEERQGRGSPRLQSGEIGPGDTYSISFAKEGTVYFYDRMNLDLRVTINVRK